MKSLIVYYSQTGNTKKVAQAIHRGMSGLVKPVPILTRFDAILEKGAVAPAQRAAPGKPPAWHRWEDGYAVQSEFPEWGCRYHRDGCRDQNLALLINFSAKPCLN